MIKDCWGAWSIQMRKIGLNPVDAYFKMKDGIYEDRKREEKMTMEELKKSVEEKVFNAIKNGSIKIKSQEVQILHLSKTENPCLQAWG